MTSPSVRDGLLVVALQEAGGLDFGAELLDRILDVAELVEHRVAERLRPVEIVAHHLDDARIVQQRGDARIPLLLRLAPWGPSHVSRESARPRRSRAATSRPAARRQAAGRDTARSARPARRYPRRTACRPPLPARVAPLAHRHSAAARPASAPEAEPRPAMPMRRAPRSRRLAIGRGVLLPYPEVYRSPRTRPIRTRPYVNLLFAVGQGARMKRRRRRCGLGV